MNKSAVILRADRQTPARFTTAEFLRMGEAGAFDDMKVELVEGELVRMNPPMSAHAARQAKIAIRLSRLFAESRIMGEVGVDLGNDTLVGCDVAVLREPVAENRLLVAADVLLVIEVAETSAAATPRSSASPMPVATFRITESSTAPAPSSMFTPHRSRVITRGSTRSASASRSPFPEPTARSL